MEEKRMWCVTGAKLSLPGQDNNACYHNQVLVGAGRWVSPIHLATQIEIVILKVHLLLELSTPPFDLESL